MNSSSIIYVFEFIINYLWIHHQLSMYLNSSSIIYVFEFIINYLCIWIHHQLSMYLNSSSIIYEFEFIINYLCIWIHHQLSMYLNSSSSIYVFLFLFPPHLHLTYNMSNLKNFSTRSLQMFQCIAATVLFLNCGKVAWVRLLVDDTIKLAHVLLYN